MENKLLFNDFLCCVILNKSGLDLVQVSLGNEIFRWKIQFAETKGV